VEDLAVGRWDPRCPYDGCKEQLSAVPIAEWSTLRPGGVYAATKRDQEDYTLLVAQSTGMSAAVCRFFNVIGERQALGNPYTGVAAIFAARCLAGVAPRVYEDGEQLRDFIHVSDVAAALSSLLGSPRLPAAMEHWSNPRLQGSFNVSTGVGSPVAAVAELACQILAPGLQPEITGDYRVGDIRACVGDPIKLMDATPWQPRVSALEALSTLFEGLRGAAPPAPPTELDRAHEDLIRHGLLVSPLPGHAIPEEALESAVRESTRWG
jgi:dTDP-L-rhamnose 4-epimerase